MKKAMFDIAGMRCGSCAIGIELMIGKMKGIKSVKVSLNERIAIVEYDEMMLTTFDIAKTVDDFGYIATVRS